MPQLSIIVPVYKTEQYLGRCIDSILNQSLNDFELILIDDGSPDNCPQICDDYAIQDKRVKVVHKDNAGVAAARNTGLDIAIGEYVTFVDSDDYIDSDMYQSMMEIARKYDCDVVMCDCVKEFANRSEIYTHEIRSGYYSYEQLKKEYYPHLIMMENVEYPATISNCLCLFRQRQSQFDKIRYIEGVRFSEDLLFGAQMMYNAKSFYYIKNYVPYHYVMNPSSATHKFVPDKWKDYTKLHMETEKYFLEKTDYDFRKQIDLMLLFFVYNAVRECLCSSLTLNEKIKLVTNILEKDIVRDMYSRINICGLPISWKLKLVTFLYKYKIGLRFLAQRY